MRNRGQKIACQQVSFYLDHRLPPVAAIVLELYNMACNLLEIMMFVEYFGSDAASPAMMPIQFPGITGNIKISFQFA